MILSLWLTSGALLLVALALVARWLRFRAYRKVFRISARRDDAFPCRGNVPAFAVSLDADGFELPPTLAARGQTAFLVLTVEASLKGHWVDPFIEIEQEEHTHRQYFERGARGRRYLNLSPLFAVSRESGRPRRVHLHGHAIGWKPEAEVILFDPPCIDGATILVLGPHPDDAEIAAFGLYAHARSWVATVTAGERGMADLAVVPRAADGARWHAFVRVWDSLAIPRLGGVPPERCVTLVYPDGQLQRMYAEISLPFYLECEQSLSRATLRSQNAAADFQRATSVCTWEGLIEDLRRLLETSNPDVVVCPHPLVDGHDDHVFTAVALEAAVRRAAPRDRTFLLYVVHRREVPLYPFGPSTALVAPPPWNEQEWLADRLYSHPLPTDVRTAKYFAVEAAHDLRTYSTGAPRTARQAFAAIARELGAIASGTGLPAGTFHRRAPRPNEIYAVASLESFSALVERALARRGVARP
jgi:LmbE family N-acetylglucosaminyl deacetylase